MTAIPTFEQLKRAILLRFMNSVIRTHAEQGRRYEYKYAGAIEGLKVLERMESPEDIFSELKVRELELHTLRVEAEGQAGFEAYWRFRIGNAQLERALDIFNVWRAAQGLPSLTGMISCQAANFYQVLLREVR